MKGEAVRLEWPDRGIAVATMIRAEAMNTLSLELIGELQDVVAEVRARRARALI